MRIAIMQPYFLPYAGYFRLMCGVDAFVVLDEVQFPRGGWVHRNRLLRDDGNPGWLTLPLTRQPLATAIRDVRLSTSVFTGEWPRRLQAFPAARWALAHPGPLGQLLRVDSDDLTANLERSLRACAGLLGLDAPFVRSSALAFDRTLRGGARLIAICHALGATRYVNAPGGRALYAVEAFARCGIRLEFLPDYRGAMTSILQRLYESPVERIRAELLENLQ